MKITQHNLNKLEAILKQSEYTVRYERGNFQSGWCLIESKKVVVLNRFLDTEGKINTLTELLPQVQIDMDKLSPESKTVYETIMRSQKANGNPILELFGNA